MRLRTHQISKRLQGIKRKHGLLENLHATATLFIKHPLRNHKLKAVRKLHLKLLSGLTGKRNAANQRYSLAKLRMMRIVNRQRNMGSV